MEKDLPSLSALRVLLRKEKPSSIHLVTSKSLGQKLVWAIQEIGLDKRNIILIPDGEKAKEWNELEKLLSLFRKQKIDRQSIVIALGGGTVGDVTGFAASIYLRGIRYIQVPTTLLAQVDSAHGGKTGINFRGYKNQIGSIYKPLAIVLEPRFLKSLGREQVIDGVAEIIKAGLIKDPSILSLLAKERIATLLRSKQLSTIIEKAIRVKRWYASRDPKEKSVRKLLNFGHTIGHSIELAHHISHGQAVINGMLEEVRISESMKYTHPSVRRNLLLLLQSLGITEQREFKVSRTALGGDKKVAARMLSLPVVQRAGKSGIVRMPLDRFIKYI